MPEDKENLSFSQRYGYTPVKTKIQLESMDDYLRNSIWNLFFRYFLPNEKTNYVVKKGTYLNRIYSNIWANFIKLQLDIMPRGEKTYIESMKEFFFGIPWFKIYDLVQFVVQTSDISSSTRSEFKQECNQVLERELSAYRFVGNDIIRITSKTEIEAIEIALQSPFGTVNKHLETALKLLSDRENPEYRNSMKESISAVEALSRIIEEEPKTTLGKLLNRLEKEKGLHSKLNKGFTALYHYTSEADGIRHGLTEDSTVGYEDAIYLLVTCSAFVNYLIAKYGE